MEIYNALASKIEQEKTEHGHIAPTYILLGENIYQRLEAEIQSRFESGAETGVVKHINAICGVPIVIDSTDKDMVGAFYKFW